MRRIFLPLAALTLLYALWNFSTDSFRVSYGWDVDWGFLLLQLLYWPAVIAAWICLAASFTQIPQKPHRTLGLCTMAAALPMSAYSLYLPEYTSLKKWHHEGELKERWFQSSQMLNHLLMKYLREHPEGISWPGEDEQIDSKNFIEYLRPAAPLSYQAYEKTYRIQVTDQGVLTPWGDPILFGVDRDGDGYVAFAGKRGSVKAGYADPWADGGFFYESAVGCLPAAIPPAIFESGANYLITLNDQDFRRLFDYRESTLKRKR
jgi:hypothetical protein